jgi:GST-like protein
MITLFRLPGASPNVQKVTIMLEETGLPYRAETVERLRGALPEGAYAEVSPNGTIPAIRDDDTGAALFESAAILHYLAEKSGLFLPADPKARADVMKWLLFEAANLCPTLIELYHCLMDVAGDIPDSIPARLRDRVRRHCGIVEAQLAAGPYLCGDYSIADIALYPWTAVLSDLAEIDLADYPKIAAWAEIMKARPAVRRAVATG